MYNIPEEILSQNMSVTTWDTLGRYPKFSLGQRNYDSASFNGLLGLMKEYKQYNTYQDILTDNYKQVYQYTERINLDDPYSREMEKLIAWKEFCNNGKLKLLKDVKGNAWVCYINGIPTRSINL